MNEFQFFKPYWSTEKTLLGLSRQYYQRKRQLLDPKRSEKKKKNMVSGRESGGKMNEGTKKKAFLMEL